MRLSDVERAAWIGVALDDLYGVTCKILTRWHAVGPEPFQTDVSEASAADARVRAAAHASAEVRVALPSPPPEVRSVDLYRALPLLVF